LGAVQSGKTNTVKLFLEAGMNVNAKDRSGWTALHFASTSPFSIDIVKLLLSKGADVNAKTKDGDTPIDMAVLQKRSSIANLLKNPKAALASSDGVSAGAVAQGGGGSDIYMGKIPDQSPQNILTGEKLPTDKVIETILKIRGKQFVDPGPSPKFAGGVFQEGNIAKLSFYSEPKSDAKTAVFQSDNDNKWFLHSVEVPFSGVYKVFVPVSK
jgi:hypothetical protein